MLERWQTYWKWLFYGLLVVSTSLAVADVGSIQRRAAIVALAAGLAGWYWWAVVRGRLRVEMSWGALASLAVAAGLWVSLLFLHPLFQLLVFSGYHVACSTPAPLRRAVPGIAVVSALVVATDSVRQGGVDPVQLVFYGVVTLALGLLVAMTQTIQEQSEERARLIARLEHTRGELAASERRAGMLAERQRLAREIHDTLAQGLASIVTLYEAARAEDARRPEDARQRIEEIGRTARANLTEARRMVWALRPRALADASLIDALDELAAAFRAETGIDTRSTVGGDARGLDPEGESTLLRVAQEALANVRKHAQATRVGLTLTYLDGAVSLDVRDDGVGFDPDRRVRRLDGQQDGGFGLTAMRERLEQSGGTLTIESATGSGTTVVAMLPTSPEEPAHRGHPATARVSDPR